jgi:hypothetical protein
MALDPTWHLLRLAGNKHPWGMRGLERSAAGSRADMAVAERMTRAELAASASIAVDDGWAGHGATGLAAAACRIDG